MCEAVQRFGEQLAAAGAFLQEAWETQAAQLQTAVRTLNQAWKPIQAAEYERIFHSNQCV